MIHDSSLSTVALLSAYTESHERHYLDLLIPFVEYCLPKEEGSVIQFAAVRSMLESEFGIAGTPEKIIKAILKRYNRKYPEAVVVDTSGNYLVRKVRDNSEFNQRRDLIRIQMQDVVRKFSSFLDSYAGFKETKSAKEMLLHFFEAYGLTLVDSVFSRTDKGLSDLSRNISNRQRRKDRCAIKIEGCSMLFRLFIANKPSRI